MNAQEAVKGLAVYGLRTGLIGADDAVYTMNRLLEMMKLEPEGEFPGELPASAAEGSCCAGGPDGNDEADVLEGLLKVLLDDAEARGVIGGGIAERDLFDTKLMSCLTPRPAETIRTFNELYKDSPQKATDWFYKMSCDSDYIRRYRIRRDRKWTAPTKYGAFDITINLSKPEKDPKAIAAALLKKQSSYPKCLLCHENEGYAGRLDHPARQNLRQIPMMLGGEQWYMQYSPYVYYNEHCIVLSGEHKPMKIERLTFRRLLEFVQMFPHYTIGSNADLPIVGGSILTHEHFQGGHYTFAMERAGIRESLTFPGFEDIKAGIVNWPMSVIRLDGPNPARLEELADRILTAWRGYSDPEAEVLAETDGTPHNTISPIARMRDGMFELDLALRNNRTTEEYPLGIFHPHQELHHIKKENIGLIEVMGLAILPPRLLDEMDALAGGIIEGADLRADPKTAAHADWAEKIMKKYGAVDAGSIREILKKEIGIAFSEVLEHAGVFKDTEAGRKQFRKFAESVK